MRSPCDQSANQTNTCTHRFIMVCALVSLLGGCSASSYRDVTQRARLQRAPISTSLNTLAQQDTPAGGTSDIDIPAAPSAWEQTALNLQQVLDNQTNPSPNPSVDHQVPQDNLGESLEADAEPPERSTLTTDTPPTVLATDTPPAQLAGPDSADSPSQSAPSELTIAQRVRQLADHLRAAAPASDDPAADLIRASILANLWPDAPDAPDSPDSPDAVTLAPGEQIRVAVAGQLALALASASSATPSLLATLDQAHADLTADGSGFSIAHAELCRRVDGYGKYDPFPAHTFLAGKPNRLIVYTEPVNFGHRRPTASDHATSTTRTSDTRWVVDLSQELTLYHEASSDLQAWHRPKARIIDASRNRQRDYYLINEIILPANLSVGSYRLKIATRDETTGALAEATITIHLVADPALAFGNR